VDTTGGINYIEEEPPVNEDINQVIKEELESWNLFGDALKNDDKFLFRQMMSEISTDEYGKTLSTRGSNEIIESMIMLLIHLQQMMIKKLIENAKRKNALVPFDV
jgi:hypothetical protein